MVITSDRFFYPILTRIINSVFFFFLFCSRSNTAFLWFKERLPEVPEYAVMRHSMITSFIQLLVHVIFIRQPKNAKISFQQAPFE